MYSGNVAYCGYKALHKALYNNTTPNALTFIILGPCHSKNNKELNVVMKDEWCTPFGPCMLDRVLATTIKNRLLQDNRVTTLRQDDTCTNKHSIQVQLPFIKHFFPESFVVPIFINNTSHISVTLASVLLHVLEETEHTSRRVVFVVSTDLSHYHSIQTCLEKDTKTIRAIMRADALTFKSLVDSNKIELCGTGAVQTLLYVLDHIRYKSHLISRNHSGRRNDDNDNTRTVVGYASILFRYNNR